MSHIRFPRAAVAIAADSTGRSAIKPHLDATKGTAPHLVLWASAALVVRDGGRLVAVRRTASHEAEVACIGPGSAHIRWRSASEVLSDAEAKRWLKMARFSKG